MSQESLEMADMGGRPNRFKLRNLDEEQKTIQYEMVSELFNYYEITNEKEFMVKRTRNTLYKGLMIEGQRQSFGVLIYENGRVYEGEWQDDKRNGRGYEQFSNQSKYIG